MKKTNNTPEKNPAEISPPAPPERMPTPAKTNTARPLPSHLKDSTAFMLAQIASPLFAAGQSYAEAISNADQLLQMASHYIDVGVDTHNAFLDMIALRNQGIKLRGYLREKFGFKSEQYLRELFMAAASNIYRDKKCGKEIWRRTLKDEPWIYKPVYDEMLKLREAGAWRKKQSDKERKSKKRASDRAKQEQVSTPAQKPVK